MNVANILFIFLSAIVYQLNFMDVEPFTAIVEAENLLRTSEETLLNVLKGRINQNENKFDKFRARLDHYIQEHENAMLNPQEYVANPVNAFLLVKRLNSWLNVTKILIKDGFIEGTSVEQIEKSLPSDEDVKDAAIGLLRLQRLYNFSAESLANGELNGTKCSKMTSDDCYELGIQAFHSDDFEYAILWMREALRKKDVDESHTDSSKEKILEYLINAEQRMENIRQQMCNRADEEGLKTPKNEDNSSCVKEKENLHPQLVRPSEKRKYEMQCRGEMKTSSWQWPGLKCRYAHKNKPYLLIAPFKEEDIVLDPPISLYHEVMYPNEIRKLKAVVAGKLERGKVRSKETGGTKISPARTSKIAWLHEDDYPFINKILHRVRLWTSLSTEYIDSLQVANYGIGGHFNLHFDFINDEKSTIEKGDRIITILFYMSNVTKGGATVFSRLNATVWPEEGSAVSWYNLRSSGVPDYRTVHAACPVLQGSKWVANLWIYQKGQDLLRLCDPSDAPSATTEAVSE